MNRHRAYLVMALWGLCQVTFFVWDASTRVSESISGQWRVVLQYLSMTGLGASGALTLYYFGKAFQPKLDIGARRAQVRRRHAGALGLFYWFCSAPNREVVQLGEADLKKDAREMRNEGRSPGFIRFVVAWKTLGIIVPIIWDACTRFVAKVLPLGKLVSRFMMPR